jgi:hypothetical protein
MLDILDIAVWNWMLEKTTTTTTAKQRTKFTDALLNFLFLKRHDTYPNYFSRGKTGFRAFGRRTSRVRWKSHLELVEEGHISIERVALEVNPCLALAQQHRTECISPFSGVLDDRNESYC